MKTTIYLTPRIAKLFSESNIEEKDNMEDDEMLLVNPESMVNAFLEDKTQISSDRACIKFKADADKLKIFFRDLKKSEPLEAKKEEAKAE